MERLAETLAIVLLATVALLTASAVGSANAEIDFTTCRESNALACGHLSVPLSASGTPQGTVTLALRRRRAPVGQPRSAVIALAGGPGQAAIPFTETFAEILGPIISTRDLIVFDQRGTGLSGALRCPAFKHVSDTAPSAEVVARCADQIGPGHGSYTTPESVADIEAIRVAGGYEKLVLYGTSYGTKVALQYAQQHPSHIEALILDSVVAPNGPDPLHLSTFEAVPRVLRELCAFGGCAHLTHDPVADLRSVVRKMGRRGLRGTVIDGHGHPHKVTISSEALLDVLVEGDLDPLLRAEFPASIRAAARGDTALMARMLLHASGGEEEEPSPPGEPASDVPLYYATVCEEEQFPWSRTARPKQRLAEARAKIGALPAGALAPFSRADVLPFGEMEECAAWPFTRPAPPLSSGPLPEVPTLILSGAEDLRTPTAGAQAVAAMIPAAHLLVVPNTGHSVLTTEPDGCAVRALHATFSGKAIKTCRATAPPGYLKPTPLAPRRLSQIKAEHGYTGRAGRTLAAVGLTFADMSRQIALAVLSTGFEALTSRNGVHVGGLRGGWASFTPRRLRLTLHRYTYVPGVEVSGWIGYERGELHIEDHATESGVLRLVKRSYVGELDDSSIDVPSKALSAQSASSRRSAFRLPPRLAPRHAIRTLEQIGGLAQTLDGAAGTGALQAISYALAHASTSQDPLR